MSIKHKSVSQSRQISTEELMDVHQTHDMFIKKTFPCEVRNDRNVNTTSVWCRIFMALAVAVCPTAGYSDVAAG